MGIFSVERFVRDRFSGIIPSIRRWQLPSNQDERNLMVHLAIVKYKELDSFKNGNLDSKDYKNALAELSDAKYYTRRYTALSFGDRDLLLLMIRVDQANYLSGISIKFSPSDSPSG